MESGPSPCLPGPGLPESGPTLLTLSTLDIIFPLAPAWSLVRAWRGAGPREEGVIVVRGERARTD